MSNITIEYVSLVDVKEAVSFVIEARRELFPTLANSPLPKDLENFSSTFFGGGGQFLVARDEDRLVGVIGYVPYDHRFAQLDYRSISTMEVIRLFILPEYRRSGLATAMFMKLQKTAKSAGIECLYLHTNRFLPGAVAFWVRQGCVITDEEDDPVWHTTHMHLMLR